MTQNTNKIAQLNDDFRAGIQCILMPPILFVKQTANVPGMLNLTSAINWLPAEERAEIIGKVKAFRDFTKANDPHCEHDFGSFFHNGDKIFWKFDYYDTDLRYGSEDPADITKTKRVLTVMMACEY